MILGELSLIADVRKHAFEIRSLFLLCPFLHVSNANSHFV